MDDNRPRVLILSTAQDISGGEVFLMSLIGALQGWKAHLATPNPVLAERCRALGAEATVIPEFCGLRRSNLPLALYRLLVVQPLALAKLWRLAGAIRPRVIMAGSFSQAHFAFVLSKLTGLPALWSHQHPVFTPDSRDRRLAAWLVTGGKMHAVGCSEAVVQSFGLNGAENVSAVVNSVDTSRFRRSEPRNSSSKPLRIALVAMITPWKGQHLLVEAVKMLRERGLGAGDLQVEFYGGIYEGRSGDVAYREHLGRLVDEFALGDQIQFCGKHDDMREVYENLDVVVNASMEPEPLGISIVEAMSMECIVVVPDEGGPAEIVIDGVDGFKFEPRSAVSLADKLERVIRAPGMLDTLRASARETAVSRFSVTGMTEKYEALFSALAGQPGARS